MDEEELSVRTLSIYDMIKRKDELEEEIPVLEARLREGEYNHDDWGLDKEYIEKTIEQYKKQLPVLKEEITKWEKENEDAERTRAELSRVREQKSGEQGTLF